jgi:cytochrome P450
MLRAFGAIRRDPLAFLDRVRAEHGDVVQFPIPVPPTYLVNDPAAVRRVLQGNHQAYGKRTRQYTSLSLVTGEGLLTADTEVWRERRRLVQPAFHHSTIEAVGGQVARAAGALAGRWSALPPGSVVDVDAAMMVATLEVVGAALFGADLTADADVLTAATVSALDLVVARARAPWTPPLAVPTPGNLAMRAALRRLDGAVDRMVADRRRQGGPERSGRPADMLDLLLAGGVLDDRAVRDEVVTFVVAGHETVASALTWAWHLLSQAPDVDAALAAEAAAVLGDRPVAVADLPRLPLARQVVDETLRLFPPAWLITRKARQPDVLAGHEIPAGALVIVSPWLVHRHHSAWADPERFDPARFAGPLDPVRRGAYLPFGAGPRMCIGKDFALVEATLLLASLSREFALRPAPGGHVRPVPLVTVRPEGGLPMVVERR